MKLVAEFIVDQFVRQQKFNIKYHTVANGWPDHEKKYAAAIPFVLGEISSELAWSKLSSEQKRGLNLFNKSCITCHELTKRKNEDKIWEKFPLSHQGCGVRCHGDGSVEFPWSRTDRQSSKGEEIKASRRVSSPYAAHGRPPKLTNLTPHEKRGEGLYQKNCAFCHAMDGTGGNWIGAFLEPHPRDLTSIEAAQNLTTEKLTDVIRNGVAGTSMSAWRHVLNESQIKAIIAYVERAFFSKGENVKN